jgi:hypothetical protein
MLLCVGIVMAWAGGGRQTSPHPPTQWRYAGMDGGGYIIFDPLLDGQLTQITSILTVEFTASMQISSAQSCWNGEGGGVLNCCEEKGCMGGVGGRYRHVMLLLYVPLPTPPPPEVLKVTLGTCTPPHPFSSEQFRNHQRHIKYIIYGSGTWNKTNKKIKPGRA